MPKLLTLPRLLVPVALLLAACSTVPITGRSQLLLLPVSQELKLGADSYQEELAKVRLSSDPAQGAMVQRVSMAIARAASTDENVLALSPEVAQFDWEVRLVEDKLINANCRPGGKMIVYTGILPVTQTEDGLAVVMGHEVAHAVAHHGNERISHGLVVGLGVAAIEVGLRKKDPKVRHGVAAAFGAFGTLGYVLPFSREHESEADHIGLILMARAGYDPREAERFWTRMKERGGGGGPEWLSTHPSHETRIEQIREWLPEAMQYYRERGP